jgi:hypothetical protein
VRRRFRTRTPSGWSISSATSIAEPRRSGAIERRGASYPDFLDWRAQATRSFEDLAAVDSQMLTLSGTDEPERIETEFVSASYFSLLRATPALGRTFRADEDQVRSPTSSSSSAMACGAPVRRRPQVLGRR